MLSYEKTFFLVDEIHVIAIRSLVINHVICVDVPLPSKSGTYAYDLTYSYLLFESLIFRNKLFLRGKEKNSLSIYFNNLIF